MRTALVASLLVGATLAVAACGPEAAPLSGHVSFDACVGRAGTCSDNCCAYSEGRLITDDTRTLDCKMFSGSNPGDLRVDFTITASDYQTGVIAKQLNFSNNTASPVGVRGCDSFTIREDGNEFPMMSDSNCGNLRPRTDYPEGGGCEVEMHLNADDVLVGRFRCQELQLPAQPLYFSTVHNGNVGWGEFRFENCADRR